MKRKLGAMLLALCLMAGMTATAFAQGDPATEPAGAPPAPQETTVEFDSPDVFINIGAEQKTQCEGNAGGSAGRDPMEEQR